MLLFIVIQSATNSVLGDSLQDKLLLYVPVPSSHSFSPTMSLSIAGQAARFQLQIDMVAIWELSVNYRTYQVTDDEPSATSFYQVLSVCLRSKLHNISRSDPIRIRTRKHMFQSLLADDQQPSSSGTSLLLD